MIKKLGILIFLFLTTLTAFSQKKCKFDYEKEDKVSGKTIRFYEFNILLAGVKIQIGNNGPQSYFNFGIDMVGEKEEVIRKETDTLYIRLANKELLTLNPKENTKGTAHINEQQRQVKTFFAPMYYMTEDQLKMLSESPIVGFKFLIEGLEYTVEMPDKKGEKIMEGFGCLKQSK